VTRLGGAPKKQLENAFQVFNQVSEQLVESYRLLQAKVRQLNEELAAARCERMQQLAEQERLAHRLRQLLDALPAAVIVVDHEDRIQQYNPAAQLLFDSIKEEQQWTELWQQSLCTEQQGDDFLLLSGRLVSLTERMLAPDPGCILLLLDVTETRELQRHLERQQRLGAMGEMSAQLAHQMRTPLTSALLYTSHLSRDDLSPSQRKRFSGHCLARLQHMERQINDMLMFARGGQFQPEIVDLSVLLKDLKHTLEPVFGDRRSCLEVEDNSAGKAFVRGNRDALLGAFINLANNALEHGKADGKLQLCLESGPDGWQLLFIDNGPGIPEQLHSRIFDPFFTTRSDGTGLGLSVVQSVALEHGGQISIRPNMEGGTCFILVLPAADIRSDEQNRIEPESTGSQQSILTGSSSA